jgi:hypothetical protein
MRGVRPTGVRSFSLCLFSLAPVLLLAQAPTIGVIDYYGNRKVPVEKLRVALGVKAGDSLPSSKSDVEERIETIPGVVLASLEAACCVEGKAILYVGVEEKGAPHFELREAPTGVAVLPLEIHAAYHHFLEALEQAVRQGETTEDLRSGHSLMANAAVRTIQEGFVDLARKYMAALREALRNSADEEQRAMAAYIIGYAPRKSDAVEELQFAMRDPDPAVRGNAMRALAALSSFAATHPDEGINVTYTWFVEMLNSVYWTDRNNAAVALAGIVEGSDRKALDLIRERALLSVVEMARWQHLPHALPAFILAGRIAGLEEKSIQDAWTKGERERILKPLLNPRKK